MPSPGGTTSRELNSSGLHILARLRPPVSHGKTLTLHSQEIERGGYQFGLPYSRRESLYMIYRSVHGVPVLLPLATRGILKRMHWLGEFHCLSAYYKSSENNHFCKKTPIRLNSRQWGKRRRSLWWKKEHTKRKALVNWGYMQVIRGGNTKLGRFQPWRWTDMTVAAAKPVQWSRSQCLTGQGWRRKREKRYAGTSCEKKKRVVHVVKVSSVTSLRRAEG